LGSPGAAQSPLLYLSSSEKFMYVLYNSLGKIVNAFQCPDFIWAAQDKGIGNSEITTDDAVSLADKYVSQGTLVTRPNQATVINRLTLLANGVDTVTISNAPNGTFTATNPATHETVNGPISGTDTFSTTVPGIYKIKIESWPYLDFETTIEAV
jgi:hypothetical protein